MPDLYGKDAAQSAAPLHPEIMIGEVRLRNVPTAPRDTPPGRGTRSVLVLPLGLIVLVVAIGYLVARLLGN